MRNYDITPFSEGRHAIVSSIGFLLLTLAAFIVIGPLLGIVVASGFYEGSMLDMVQKLQSPTSDPEMRQIIFVLQGFATGVGLIIIPWLYIKYVNKRSITELSPKKGINLLALLICSLVVFSFMAVNSFFIEWNAGMNLPDFMKGMEDWMRVREEAAAELTEFMTTFDSKVDLAFAILVIAILPAIGEELVFRGYIQTHLLAGFRNPHIAIWVSAILFSAIHLQFFGFIPRMLLGALFGYLYLWSGNLMYPIIAHFVNNAGQLIVVYLVQQGTTDIDVNNPESFPLTVIILFSFITFGLLFYFRRAFETGNSHDA